MFQSEFYLLNTTFLSYQPLIIGTFLLREIQMMRTECNKANKANSVNNIGNPPKKVDLGLLAIPQIIIRLQTKV